MPAMLDFITYTKGMEYLIAIAFICVFIAFWMVLHRRGKGMLIRIAPLGVITVALGNTACLDTHPATTICHGRAQRARGVQAPQGA